MVLFRFYPHVVFGMFLQCEEFKLVYNITVGLPNSSL